MTPRQKTRFKRLVRALHSLLDEVREEHPKARYYVNAEALQLLAQDDNVGCCETCEELAGEPLDIGAGDLTII